MPSAGVETATLWSSIEWGGVMDDLGSSEW